MANNSDSVKSNANGGMESKTVMEPSEDDPCMMDEDGKKVPKSAKQRWMLAMQRRRDEMSKKTGLSHRGLYYVGAIVVLCILLLMVVIALAAAWPRRPHKHQFPVCSNSACLRAAAQVNEGFDSTTSPCGNLWGWACQGWLQRHPLPKDRSVWNRKQQLLRRETERVRDVIATLKMPLHMGSVEWKLKRLYDACMDVDSRRADEAQPLVSIINELGGWYILKEWNIDDFDPKPILQELHVKYGVSPFFVITVEPNPHTPETNSIRISPSGLGLPNKEYYYSDEDERIQNAYKELIRDVIMYLGTTRKEATKFGVDMFSYEKRIAEITPDLETLQNPISTYNPFSISELKETVQIAFYDILTAMYPEANISENTEVIVTSMEYLSQVSRIIQSSDKTVLNGYLIWTLVKSYLPYLSERYVSAMQSFTTELLGVQQPPETWETCSNLVQNFMGLAIEQFHPIDNNTTQVLTEMFTSIVDVVKSRVDKFRSSANLQNQYKKKLSTLSLQIGVPEISIQESYLKKYYSKLKIIKADLFTSTKNSIIFPKKLEESRLLQKNATDNLLHEVLSERTKVFYSPAENTIVIPRLLASEPYIESNFPSSILYSRLGVEIAHAVLSSVLPYGSLWTAERKILSPFHMIVNESLDSVRDVKKCLSDYILNLNTDLPSKIANETALNTLKHISAVSIANEALLAQQKTKPHIHQPSLEEFDDSALFFLSYAQTQCTESTTQQQLYDKLLKFELSQKTILHLVWSQLPEFAKEFDCSFNKKTLCRDSF